MQRRGGLRDRLVSLLELPGDAMLDVARVTLVGDMEMVIENHRGLTEYTPDRVVMTVPEGLLAVDGEDLKIAAISPEQVILLGKIRGMRYAAPGGGAS
ncbi:MAG: sporulation protein YqfC [Bacillota bacterium]